MYTLRDRAQSQVVQSHGHTLLAMSCILYLRYFGAFSDRFLPIGWEKRKIATGDGGLERVPLLIYAAKSWPFHAR